MSRKVKYSIEEKLNAVQNYLDGKESMYSIVIIPGLFEPPVRTLRATIPENESHIFR